MSLVVFPVLNAFRSEAKDVFFANGVAGVLWDGSLVTEDWAEWAKLVAGLREMWGSELPESSEVIESPRAWNERSGSGVEERVGES